MFGTRFLLGLEAPRCAASIEQLRDPREGAGDDRVIGDAMLSGPRALDAAAALRRRGDGGGGSGGARRADLLEWRRDASRGPRGEQMRSPSGVRWASRPPRSCGWRGAAEHLPCAPGDRHRVSAGPAIRGGMPHTRSPRRSAGGRGARVVGGDEFLACSWIPAGLCGLLTQEVEGVALRGLPARPLAAGECRGAPALKGIRGGAVGLLTRREE